VLRVSQDNCTDVVRLFLFLPLRTILAEFPDSCVKKFIGKMRKGGSEKRNLDALVIDTEKDKARLELSGHRVHLNKQMVFRMTRGNVGASAPPGASAFLQTGFMARFSRGTLYAKIACKVLHAV